MAHAAERFHNRRRVRQVRSRQVDDDLAFSYDRQTNGIKHADDADVYASRNSGMNPYQKSRLGSKKWRHDDFEADGEAGYGDDDWDQLEHLEALKDHIRGGPAFGKGRNPRRSRSVGGGRHPRIR